MWSICMREIHIIKMPCNKNIIYSFWDLTYTIFQCTDRNIIISNGIILKIINASKTDTGNYTCTAHNSVGHTKRQFRVDVLQKPRIIRSPVSKSSPPSSTVRLDCIAEGNPEPKITWLKNGDILNYTARIKKQPRGLVFSHTFTSDSGEFWRMFLLDY